MQNCFYILVGKNGATYILNISNKVCINNSIKFYKANSIKLKIKKRLLKSYLTILRLGNIKVTKTPKQINSFLQAKFKVSLDFNINANCSMLISPTGDKLIVHHHDKYFQKFAFGKSHNNVIRESEIYKILGKPKHFKTSQLFDFVNDKQLNYCEFKLKTETNIFVESKITSRTICRALAELFQTNSVHSINVNEYIYSLIDKYSDISRDNFEQIERVANSMYSNNNDKKIPLGLVHRDFKPWNTLQQDKLLIYDFEEAVLNGPPLEDLLNYFIDPKINYISPSELSNSVLSEKKILLYKDYLKSLEINVHFLVLFFTYLLERIIFWSYENNPETAQSYIIFLEHLIQQNKFEA